MSETEAARLGPPNKISVIDEAQSAAAEVQAVPATPMLAEEGVHTVHEPYVGPNDLPLLAVLCIAHFFNDFCLGVAAPMIPKMEVKYGLGLGVIAGVVAVVAIMANFVQPVAGHFMSRSKTAAILILTPFVAGVSLLVGFTTHAWQAALLFGLAGASIGAFHPYSFVLAQTTMPRRPALTTAIFIAFGFGGVSFATMISGHWMEHLGFRYFYLLYLLAFVVSGLMLFKRFHRLELADYMNFSPPPKENVAKRNAVPFGLLMFIGLILAIENGTIMFFTPKLFHELYQSEGKGGNAGFMFGLLGGLGSFYYAARADRGTTFRAAILAQALGIVPLFYYFYADGWQGKTIAVTFVGATIGATFPLIASMARDARGLTVAMRSSMILGGVWGTTTLILYGMAQLPNENLSLESVMSIIRFFPPVAIVIMFICDRKYAS